MKKENLFTGMAGIGLLIIVALGCGGGQTCVADLVVEGKTHTGRASGTDQAQKNACSKYCIEGNPDFDAVYERWLTTPEAKKASGRSKWDAQFYNKELKEIVARCQIRCKEFVDDGVYKMTVNCN